MSNQADRDKNKARRISLILAQKLVDTSIQTINENYPDGFSIQEGMSIVTSAAVTALANLIKKLDGMTEASISKEKLIESISDTLNQVLIENKTTVDTSIDISMRNNLND